MKVLDIGCGAGTTAIEIAEKYGCTVTAADIDVKMLRKTEENVNNSASKTRIRIVNADIQQMPFEDEEFDVILVEAVTMFVDRHKAVNEIFRVCKKDGKVVEQELIWRQQPTDQARKIFEGELCPGIEFENTDDWLKLYKESGFKTGKFITGTFTMMSTSGFIRDEGIIGTLKLLAKTFTRISYIKKMVWLMKRISKVRNQLGYVVFEGVKQAKELGDNQTF
jgi:SAM-dependent methyltransferase